MRSSSNPPPVASGDSGAAPLWLDIEIFTDGPEVRVSARGCRGERPPVSALPAELGVDALKAFTAKVGRAARLSGALDPAALQMAQSLYGAIFSAGLREILARLSEASPDLPVLVRVFAMDRALETVPWEALCEPETKEGFVGTDPRIIFARGVASSDPWDPREVRGAVRVLAIAPGSAESALKTLHSALAPSIEAGETEWLPPIEGPLIDARVLFERLRRSQSPHIIHFLGHGGVDPSGQPVLRLADGEDGEEVWITAEALGRELNANFSEELRLVVLEACEGAKQGVFGSAAEILGKAGVMAVVAHLWPVKADVARTCSSTLYKALTASSRTAGDIGASVAAARRTLLADSAEAFSPVLYLRGMSSVLFDFQGRHLTQPRGDKTARIVAPALQAVLQRPFTVVIGDLEEDRAALHAELTKFMTDAGDPPAKGISLSALTQRCSLEFGQDVLLSLFQQALTSSFTLPAPPLVRSLARFVTPGVHITLLWHPYLERALAEQHTQWTVYAIQPSFSGLGGKPRIIKRAAGSQAWKTEATAPRHFDIEHEIVVLRLYGGYTAEPMPIFSNPLITEDDHINGLIGTGGFRPPGWIEELLARPRIQPGVFVALSSLDWRHRMLLRWLYDHHPAPEDSVALLNPGSDPRETGIWESGAGLPGTTRIAAISGDPSQLAAELDELAPGAP
jgi:hypothetical protein